MHISKQYPLHEEKLLVPPPPPWLMYTIKTQRFVCLSVCLSVCLFFRTNKNYALLDINPSDISNKHPLHEHEILAPPPPPGCLEKRISNWRLFLFVSLCFFPHKWKCCTTVCKYSHISTKYTLHEQNILVPHNMCEVS